jgi:hypothetical protein
MRNAVVCIVLLSLAAVPGCKSSHELALREGIALVNQLTDLLSTITDGRSAEEARPKLKTLLVRLRDVGYRLNRVEKRPGDQTTELADKYRQEYEDARKRFRKALAKAASDPGAAKVIEQVFDEEFPGILEE